MKREIPMDTCVGYSTEAGDWSNLRNQALAQVAHGQPAVQACGARLPDLLVL